MAFVTHTSSTDCSDTQCTQSGGPSKSAVFVHDPKSDEPDNIPLLYRQKMMDDDSKTHKMKNIGYLHQNSPHGQSRDKSPGRQGFRFLAVIDTVGGQERKSLTHIATQARPFRPARGCRAGSSYLATESQGVSQNRSADLRPGSPPPNTPVLYIQSGEYSHIYSHIYI